MLVCVCVLSQFSWERDQPRARRTTRCSISSYPPDNDSSRVPVRHVPLFSNRSPKTTLQRPLSKDPLSFLESLVLQRPISKDPHSILQSPVPTTTLQRPTLLFRDLVFQGPLSSQSSPLSEHPLSTPSLISTHTSVLFSPHKLTFGTRSVTLSSTTDEYPCILVKTRTPLSSTLSPFVHLLSLSNLEPYHPPFVNSDDCVVPTSL